MLFQLLLACDKDPFSALHLLELGRDVMVCVWLDVRFNNSNLRESYPELTNEFEEVQDLLDVLEGNNSETYFD